MISKHCGTRLRRVTPDGVKLVEHRWICPVCGKRFHQRLRRANSVESWVAWAGRVQV